ncbi:MAG: CotH kinase family protein [Bacteroidota bacterium]
MDRLLMIRIFLLFWLCALLWQLPAQDLYNINKVNEIHLDFEQDDWYALLNQYKDAGEDARLLATLRLNGVEYDSVGVRYKGNSSFYNVRKSDSSKLPFNVKLNFKKKSQCLPGGIKTLKLSNVFRDPSFLREVMAYEVARSYMPASTANYAIVHVNGEKLGLYNLTESVDKAFLRKHFGYDKGTLIKCDPTWDAAEIKGCPKGEKASLIYQGQDSICYERNYEMKSKNGWTDLVKLAWVLEKTPDQIGEFINVDAVLWMHAFNNVLVNLDSYSGRLCHNYYLFKDSFGLFQPIVWDMNLAFGGFRFDGNNPRPMSNKELQEMGLFLHYKNDFRPLISKILKNSLNRKIYVAHVRTIVEDYLDSGKFKERAAEVHKFITPYVKEDVNKLYPFETFSENLNQTAAAGRSKIIGLNELMDARQQHLAKHPLLKKEPPAIGRVEHIARDKEIVIRAQVENTRQVYLAYRFTEFAPFQRLELFDDGEHDDLEAGDGIYGATLERQNLCQYYIIGENERSASLSPRNAAHQFHEFKLSFQASQ